MVGEDTTSREESAALVSKRGSRRTVRTESCLLGDLKGRPDDLNVGKSKKEEVGEIRNSWMTEYAEIAFKEKENENKTLKKEYKAFVDEYAKASNQILKVMAKQKKEIADLKLKNGNQKMNLSINLGTSGVFIDYAIRAIGAKDERILSMVFQQNVSKNWPPLFCQAPLS